MDSRRRYTQVEQNGLPRGPGLPRGIRPQRSMVDISTRSRSSRRDWNDAPGLPSSPHKREYGSETRPTTIPYRVSKVSLSSASSQGSSTFSREQAYESSTSIEEPPSSKPTRREWASSYSQSRQRSSIYTADISPSHDGNVFDSRRYSAPLKSADRTGGIGAGADGSTIVDGYGASLWNRIATAANSLTINVSQAWTAGLFTEDGQVTPHGGETRLTRALKSYHLNKARTTAELPAWLFSEDERRVSRSKITSSHRDEGFEAAYPERELPTSKRRGLKDIYADVNAEASMSENVSRYPTERGSAIAHRRFDEPELRDDGTVTGGHLTKASSRLQAMRAARRPNREQQEETVVGYADELNRGSSRSDERREEIPVRRVGLPTGPKQQRRY